MFSLSICSPRVFEVFIFKLIKSKVSHNSHIVQSNFIYQYTIYYMYIVYWHMKYANHFWLHEIVLKLSGVIEENPRPKPSSNQSFSVCHWNLNSISAHNYMKVSLLRVYISTHKFDVICLWLWYIWWRQSENCRLQLNSSRSSI